MTNPADIEKANPQEEQFLSSKITLTITALATAVLVWFTMLVPLLFQVTATAIALTAVAMLTWFLAAVCHRRRRRRQLKAKRQAPTDTRPKKPDPCCSNCKSGTG